MATTLFTTYSRLLVMPLVFCLANCNRPAGVQPAKHSKPIILVIQDQQITSSALNFYKEKNFPEVGENIDDEMWRYIFDQFLQELKLFEMAKTMGYQSSDEQVQSFIEDRLTSMSFHLLSPEDQKLWRETILRRLSIQELLHNEILNRAAISEEGILAYYQEHPSRFKQETHYQLRFFQTDDKKKAQSFYRELRRSKKLFQQLADGFTTSESHQLAVSVAQSALLSSFVKAVKRLRPGQYTRVLTVPHGETKSYYVLYLEAIQPGKTIDFQEAYHEIRNQLRRQAAQELLQARLASFRDQIRLEIFSQALPFSYETSQKEGTP